MTIPRWSSGPHRQASALAMAAALIGGAAAHASHGTPPPPPPPGHGQVLVRVVRSPGDAETVPGGEVMLDGVDLHRAGAGPEEGWVRLPPLRPTFSTAELTSGQVWVANGPVAAGQFDRIRLAPGRGAPVPLALHLAAGQWTTLSLEVRVQQAPGRGGLRLELRRARMLSAR